MMAAPDDETRAQPDETVAEDLDLNEAEARKVGGGVKAPAPPAGPVPVPYPNLET